MRAAIVLLLVAGLVGCATPRRYYVSDDGRTYYRHGLERDMADCDLTATQHGGTLPAVVTPEVILQSNRQDPIYDDCMRARGWLEVTPEEHARREAEIERVQLAMGERIDEWTARVALLRSTTEVTELLGDQPACWQATSTAPRVCTWKMTFIYDVGAPEMVRASRVSVTGPITCTAAADGSLDQEACFSNEDYFTVEFKQSCPCLGKVRAALPRRDDSRRSAMKGAMIG